MTRKLHHPLKPHELGRELQAITEPKLERLVDNYRFAFKYGHERSYGASERIAGGDRSDPTANTYFNKKSHREDVRRASEAVGELVAAFDRAANILSRISERGKGYESVKHRAGEVKPEDAA